MRNHIFLLSIIGYFLFSIFMSDYFVALPTMIKEFLLLPAILLLVLAIIHRGLKVRMNMVVLIYLLILLMYSIIGILNGAPDSFAIRYYIIPVILYIITLNYIEERYLAVINNFFKFYLFLVSGVFLIQFIKNYEILSSVFPYRFITPEGADYLKVNRLYLFFVIPTVAGTTISSIYLYCFLAEASTIRRIILSVIFIPVLVLVFSRTAVIALFFALILFLFLTTRSKFMKFQLLLLLSLILFFVVEFILSDQAMVARFESYGSIMHYINWFGNGIGFVTVSGRVADNLIIDNDYLRFLYETGILGLLAFLGLIASIILRYRDKRIIVYSLFILMLMLTGEFHSMYPAPQFCYVSLALLIRRPA